MRKAEVDFYDGLITLISLARGAGARPLTMMKTMADVLEHMTKQFEEDERKKRT